MSGKRALPFLLCALAALSGCATYDRHGLDPQKAVQVEKAEVIQNLSLSRDLETKILALNPEHVTEKDIHDVLSKAPAPRIINIHGGIYPVHEYMISFTRFLIGMGYPEKCVRNAGDGTYTYSCYESSDMLAGLIGWYYERDGLRPMLVGHSQGGIQTVKVLYRLSGDPTDMIPVWNPLTWQCEPRYQIIDPLTGRKRPVSCLQVSYATAVGSGGLTRMLPNQWDMNLKLRTIPDSVDEFTGFCKGADILGGDYLGYGSANEYESAGKAVVCNVWLPVEYRHGRIPVTDHLLKSKQIMDWINNYKPSEKPVDTPKVDVTFEANSDHILWAAEVWFRIKKHWAIELQHLIQAQHPLTHGS
jgi:hypothetical protein